MPAAVVGTVETGAVIATIITIAISVAKYAHGRIDDRLTGLEEDKADADLEQRVADLEEAHNETRRLAEAAYTTVHGDNNRPEDSGFVVESRERRNQLEDDVEEVGNQVARLEQSHEIHQRKIEAMLDAMAEELDVDMMWRGDGGRDGGGRDGGD